MMNYPRFFDTIETIVLQDPLSNFLGTFEKGELEFSYVDIVKNAGHSCPTVAGAYLMCLVGLNHLYPNETPQRGGIKVFFKESKDDGVSGVIANVISHITGATDTNGFQGINGNFNRTKLLSFDENIQSSIKLQRVDTNQSIELIYNPSCIEIDEKQKLLMGKVIQGVATNEDKALFAKLWQQRVENIFNNIDKVITIKND